jgi:hypothetical protein
MRKNKSKEQEVPKNGKWESKIVIGRSKSLAQGGYLTGCGFKGEGGGVGWWTTNARRTVNCKMSFVPKPAT